MDEKEVFPITIPFRSSHEDGWIEITPVEAGVLLEAFFQGGGGGSLPMEIDRDKVLPFIMGVKAAEIEGRITGKEPIAIDEE